MSVLQDRYFALAPPSELHRIWGRLDQLTGQPHIQAAKWWAADMQYYGDSGPQGMTWAVTRGGGEGELAVLRVNRARAMLKAKIALITASQVAWDVSKKKDSAAAGYATALSKSLLETLRDDVLATLDVQWQEWCEVYAEAYTFVEWDRTRGPVGAVTPGGPVKAGDCRINLLPPWFVITDPLRPDPESQDWWFIRLDRPRADLIKLHEKVLVSGQVQQGEEAADAIWSAKSDLRHNNYVSGATQEDSVAVVHFIHRPTLALPKGRHVVMLNSSVILRDTDLVGVNGDYDENGGMPIIRRASDERAGTPYAWASYWDTFGAQQIIDAHSTTQATTITTFGNPILCVPDGGNFEPQDAATFGRSYKIPPGGSEPKYLEPAQLDETAMKFDEGLVEAQQQILSLNDAALGQTGTTDKNAQADALAASMAVQAVGPATISRRRSLAALGQSYLTTLRHNVTAKRVAKIVGEGQANLMADTKYWTGEDLGPVDGVTVEERSPMESTIQGREAILTSYKEMGLIKTPEQMAEVRATGRLARVVDPVRDQLQLLAVEYEQLCQGQMPIVHPLQNALVHYPANRSVLDSVSAMMKPNVVKAVQDTLDKRYFFFFGVWPNGAPNPQPAQPGMPPPMPLTPPDPLKLDRQRFLLGEGPLPMPLPPPGMPPPGAGGASPSNNLHPQPEPSPQAGSPPINGPKNPLGGQPFSPTTAPVQ